MLCLWVSFQIIWDIRNGMKVIICSLVLFSVPIIKVGVFDLLPPVAKIKQDEKDKLLINIM